MNLGLSLGHFLQRFGWDITGSTFNIRLVRAPLKPRLFNRCKLEESPDGYWSLSPMPSQIDLDHYYAQEYWEVRTDQSLTVNSRDLSHYYQLRESWRGGWATRPSDTPLRVLNFGSGHGGLSHLLHADGWEVTNVEPGGSSSGYRSRWSQVRSLQEVDTGTKFDLIYSSNALEHVADIKLTLASFLKLSNADTVFFFEVPDGETPGYGGSDGDVHPPHTYYFSCRYFQSLFKEAQSISSFRGSGMFEEPSNFREMMVEPGSGDCIRAIGVGLKGIGD